MDRREFLKVMSIAFSTIPWATFSDRARSNSGIIGPDQYYSLSEFGDIRFLHITDCHAQLLPIYYREPDINIGIAAGYGKLPHLVGEKLMKLINIPENSREAYAYTHVNFRDLAELYGRVGGFAYLKTLIDKYRNEFRGRPDNTLLLDGGDTWQGSATALWTSGKDMVKASNLLGVDVMTGHWEFTYGEKTFYENIGNFNGNFVAHNITVKDESLFEGVEAYDEDTGHAFPPYVIKSMAGFSVAIIGQAFPYTPIAHPGRLVPHWSFGIREQELQTLIDHIRGEKKVNVIVLLSHNGMDVDLKLAGRVSGIDLIMGGHTHDAVPKAIVIENRIGKTIVTNAGSNGKYLGVMDIKVGRNGIADYRYYLKPVFPNLLKPDAGMQNLIRHIRKPFEKKLGKVLAVTDSLLYRRGNFNGTFDQLICNAQMAVNNSQIAFSPGFRWGTTILPGQEITLERLLDQTAITYPNTYVRELLGSEIKDLLEDVADNLFNPDPYYQQGGDMVRSGGIRYTLSPSASSGSRISNLTLSDGTKISPDKRYRASGWASTGENNSGAPIWEIVSDYLNHFGVINIQKTYLPDLAHIKHNPGISIKSR